MSAASPVVAPHPSSRCQLLIVDPQNDFCDGIEGATLPVPGAHADLQRVAGFIEAAGSRLTDIVVTLDSHPAYAIERPSFWQTADGGPVAPFTQITLQQVKDGAYAPRDRHLAEHVRFYLGALEASPKQYRLMVWPTHCVTGTPGHNIHADVAQALAAWESRSLRVVEKVLKGRHPLTEQYSAVKAEVPLPDDPSTGIHHVLVDRIVSFAGLTFIAGEASSHCVAATAEDLLEAMTPERRHRVVLLRDCMSPVTGFEAGEAAFFQRAADWGVRSMTAAEALALVAAG
ncbi:isochorismatase family protein [Roseateles sp. SL47]|uniref:isochorismatase family protein n=1 Tax=Roseateles sp. SL47 TaxID=2995138 RepID=UPI0022707B3C|nr:isochorismatase family protein [Roseateles sp. SL47]WAC73370.1 isochorismatase family protein [Roseateles sp. SL47]